MINKILNGQQNTKCPTKYQMANKILMTNRALNGKHNTKWPTKYFEVINQLLNGTTKCKL